MIVGHPDGGRRARRPRPASTTLRVFYFFYLLQRARLRAAAGRCPTRCCSRAGSTRLAARRWASPTWASASAARSCRCVAHALTQAIGWRGALRTLGVLMIVIALPAALFVREPPARRGRRPSGSRAARSIGAVLPTPAFYLLALGSMASIGAVGGTMQNLKLLPDPRPRARPGRASPPSLSLDPRGQHRRAGCSWAAWPTAGPRST